jgi:hypothetical protein
MTIYAQQSRTRKNKSTPTLNQEVLVKVFQSQQKKESGGGQNNCLIERKANRPYNTWISLTTLMMVMTMWQLTACPSKVPSFVIHTTVNNFLKFLIVM